MSVQFCELTKYVKSLPTMSMRQDTTWKRDTNTSANKPVPTGDPLAVIYNEGLWRISQVTPLLNIRYQPVKLKQYAAKVRQGIVGVVQASSVKYKVTFDEQPYLRYSDEDSSGLVITVSSSTHDNSKTKVAYQAVFLSWGVTKNLDRATHLPYMLERGEQKIGASVRATLQSLFDCNIRQFSFTQYQLLQFGFNFVDNDSSRSTDPFSLVFRTPQVNHKDKLSISFEVGDITIIWNGLKDETTNPSELVTLTYQILQNQIFHMIEMDVTVLDLYEVNLSKAEVKSNGVVKMKTPEIINSVFTVLNEISFNYMDVNVSKVFDNDNTIMED